MFSLEGYQDLNQIATTLRTILFRGIRVSDGCNVIIKIINSDYPSADDIGRIKNEFDIIKDLNIPQVIKAYSLERYKNSFAIVQEDLQMPSLAEVLKQRTLTIKEFLKLALEISVALGEIHKAHVIHKDINPSNILCDVDNNQIKIIDFSLATRLTKEVPGILNLSPLEGTLLYISPEQTKQINRGVDYRTDYYSLGVTFYHMLTNKLPFQADDAMGIIHGHIAKKPVSPTEMIPTIPQTISDIVLKLMAKTAEDRYQSIYGLCADLRNCLEQLNQKIKITAFPIASHDLHDHFQIPDKLYGREKEIAHMMAIKNKSEENKSQLILLTGPSGIGKTVLVQEVYSLMLKENNSYFLMGKCNQLHRNVPYTPFLQAFHDLITQILTSSDQEVALWRTRILDALGKNARVMIDVIPSLELLIGKMEPVPHLDAFESENRFNLVFHRFINILCESKHPILLFLDDLQWADLASLELLKGLLSSHQLNNMIVIGTYRDNEVDRFHSLYLTLHDLKKAKVLIQSIAIKPLELHDIEHLLTDTLHREAEVIYHLSELCLKKTKGNPFFVNQFLHSLYADGLIRFDYDSHYWIWDTQQIEQKNITDNVVELMVEKLNKLSSRLHEYLKTAACVGNQFSAELLALVEQVDLPIMVENLMIAQQEGLIIHKSHYLYEFAHDKIQEATYSTIDSEDKKLRHVKLGRTLIRLNKEENIFSIVNQFNAGKELISDSSEKLELATLCLAAVKKSKLSAAFSTANQYIKSAVYYIKDIQWETQPDLFYDLYCEAVQLASINGEDDLVDHYTKIVFAHTKDKFARARISQLKASAYVSQLKSKEAVKIIVAELKNFGIKLSVNPSHFDIVRALIAVKWAFYNKTDEDILNLPDMTDPEKKTVINDLMLGLTSAAYQACPNLFPVICCKSAAICVKYGNTQFSPFFYSAYAYILANYLGDIDKAYSLEMVCEKLVNKLPVNNNQRKELQVRVGLANTVSLYAWKGYIRDIYTLMDKYYRYALDVGDIEYAANLTSFCVNYMYFAGESLSDINKVIISYQMPFKQLKRSNGLCYLAVVHHAISHLMDTELSEDTYNIYLSNATDVSDEYFLSTHYLHKAILEYANCHYEVADKNMQLAEKHKMPILGAYMYPVMLFYQALIKMALYKTVSAREKRNTHKIIKNALKKLMWYTKACEKNFSHMYKLISAEYARILGKQEEAGNLYDEAISLARENRFLSIEALANELAANYYQEKNKLKFASSHLRDAHYCYNLWGATKKTKMLEKLYPAIFSLDRDSYADPLQRFSNTPLSLTPTDSIDVTRYSSTQILVLNSAFKASEALASTINFSELLTKMMQIVMESAGAQTAYLILQKNDKWAIEAQGYIKDQEIKINILQSMDIDTLPKKLIQYVIHTKEVVIIDSVNNQMNQLMSDEDLSGNERKAILCLPLLHHGVLNGILYFENNMTAGAFMQSRVKLLKLLSTQISISLDNSRLYTDTIALNKSLSDLNLVYKRFVPEEFLTLLEKKNIIDVRLGDQVQKEITVLFVDIRDFTNLSEKKSPKDNFIFINHFINQMEPIIRNHHGFIDKYIGDAIMALFPTSPNDALESAVDMQSALYDFNKWHIEQGGEPISIGIGINTGPMMIGTVGNERHMEGTVISDAVNVASRVEELTKEYDLPLLITDNSYAKLSSKEKSALRKVDEVILKGKTKRVTIYTSTV